MEYHTECFLFISPGQVSQDTTDPVEIEYYSLFFFHWVAPVAWQQHITAPTGDRHPESKYMSHRHRRHASSGSHGTNMFYFDCQLDPVRLTDHLQGTRKSEQKKGCMGTWCMGTGKCFCQQKIVLQVQCS